VNVLWGDTDYWTWGEILEGRIRGRGGGYRIVGAFSRFPSCIDLRGSGRDTWRRDLWQLVETGQTCSP
jgi:hypothetical protein